MDEWNHQMEAQTGLLIRTHNMMAEGICKDCLKKEKQ